MVIALKSLSPHIIEIMESRGGVTLNGKFSNVHLSTLEDGSLSIQQYGNALLTSKEFRLVMAQIDFIVVLFEIHLEHNLPERNLYFKEAVTLWINSPNF